jgi:ABC-type sulfate transport system permease component
VDLDSGDRACRWSSGCRWVGSSRAPGITLPFSPAAVVMAETFVAMPFLIVTVEGAPECS